MSGGGSVCVGLLQMISYCACRVNNETKGEEKNSDVVVVALRFTLALRDEEGRNLTEKNKNLNLRDDQSWVETPSLQHYTPLS